MVAATFIVMALNITTRKVISMAEAVRISRLALTSPMGLTSHAVTSVYLIAPSAIAGEASRLTKIAHCMS